MTACYIMPVNSDYANIVVTVLMNTFWGNLCLLLLCYDSHLMDINLLSQRETCYIPKPIIYFKKTPTFNYAIFYRLKLTHHPTLKLVEIFTLKEALIS